MTKRLLTSGIPTPLGERERMGALFFLDPEMPKSYNLGTPLEHTPLD